MPKLDHKEVRLPAGLNKVPRDSGGIYSMHASLPSDIELQLTNGSVEARENLSFLFNKICALLAHDQYGVTFERQVHGEHLKNSMKGSLATESNKALTLVHEAFASQMKTTELADVFRTCLKFCPPLYIGITSEQSLRSRLRQHLKNTSPFMRRVTKFSVPISMISYKWYDLETNEPSALRSFEKLIQHITLPKLSFD